MRDIAWFSIMCGTLHITLDEHCAEHDTTLHESQLFAEHRIGNEHCADMIKHCTDFNLVRNVANKWASCTSQFMNMHRIPRLGLDFMRRR